MTDLEEASGTLDHEVPESPWQRLHPLTPVLQGGVVVAGALGVAFAAIGDALLTQLSALIVFQEIQEVPSQELPPLPEGNQLLIVLGLVAVAALVGIGWLWLTWRLHTYRITDEIIEVKSGVIFRTHRRARRDRINSVSIWRPVVPRILGLAKLEFQAAGSDANVTLAYLPDGEAMELRRRVLLTQDTPVVQEVDPDSLDILGSEEGEVKVLVPTGRLAGSLLLSLETAWLLGVLAGISVAFGLTGDLEWWLGAIPAVFVYGATVVRGWARANRFRLAVVGDAIRISYGFLSTTAEVLPPRRIHQVTLSQPWPWRFFGWWRVEVKRASTPGQETKQGPGHSMVLPVGTLEDAISVVDLILHQALGEGGREAIAVAATGSLATLDEGTLSRKHVIRPALVARLRLLLSYHVHSAGLVNDAVWLRTGVLIRRLALIPLERLQSVGTFRGPWHVLWGLSGFATHTVSGPGLSRLVGFRKAEADELFREVAQAVVVAVGRSRSQGVR